ncbi:MAG: hypothetical protein J6M15_06800 [Prevotella sp.]|nr:hypothetical protein [Prevotella sp.]
MKKVLLVLLMMTGMLTAHADSYTYLTFEKSDGTLTSVPLSSLSITISGNTLTAGDQSFALADLTKMYFTTADVTAIDEVKAAVNGEVEVFSMNGVAMGKYTTVQEAMSSLRTGVYIVKSNGKTVKVAVK